MQRHWLHCVNETHDLVDCGRSTLDSERVGQADEWADRPTDWARMPTDGPRSCLQVFENKKIMDETKRKTTNRCLPQLPRVLDRASLARSSHHETALAFAAALALAVVASSLRVSRVRFPPTRCSPPAFLQAQDAPEARTSSTLVGSTANPGWISLQAHNNYLQKRRR